MENQTLQNTQDKNSNKKDLRKVLGYGLAASLGPVSVLPLAR